MLKGILLKIQIIFPKDINPIVSAVDTIEDMYTDTNGSLQILQYLSVR